MMKIVVTIGVNFALALLATFAVGLAAGAIFAILTAGWLYAWRRTLLTPRTVFRGLVVQFCVFNILMLWLWRWPR
jgi:hypothetical protein